MRGFRSRSRHGRHPMSGIELLAEEAAYTTVVAAVTILAVLALLFSSVSAVWSMARSGDVQVAADAAALAGANAVSSYYTVATTVDATVLSMGLAGFVSVGAGMLGTLIPGMEPAAHDMLDSGIEMLQARNELCASASEGLQKLEAGLPFVVAARATGLCRQQGSERLSYAGTALAAPRTSDSYFPALEGPAIDTGSMELASEELDEAAERLRRAREKSAAEKERAWLADCGRDGMNMQERADRLSGIAPDQNPDFASSVTWAPEAGLRRARAYYRWRFEHEAPVGNSVEDRADSAARKVFYEYAAGVVEAARVEEGESGFVNTLEPLPRNTDDVRETPLYTDARWATSIEAAGTTLHYAPSCPGATGASGGGAALCDVEAGRVRECETCRFGVGDMGRVPAASTSIENGFEYHFRSYTLALRDYAAARGEEYAAEEHAKGSAEGAGSAFEEALAALRSERPRIAPPGRYGCVALVVSGDVSSAGELSSSFASDVHVGARGAISAAALARDPATHENNVLASFLSSISSDGGLPGMADEVLGLWGRLLLAYGNASERIGEALDDLLGGSAGSPDSVGGWLEERVMGALNGLSLEPVDLSLRKPVLTDSAHVLARGDLGSASELQKRLRSIAPTSSDPMDILRAVGYELEEAVLSAEIVVARIPLPGGGTLPLTVRLGDFVSEGGAAS